MTKVSINYVCFLNSSGYSQAAQNFILSLHNSNKYIIKITPIGGKVDNISISEEKQQIFKEMITNQLSDNSIQILHCIPTIQRRYQKMSKNIGFATFETFSPPLSWTSILNDNDGIIVPSQFNLKIFAHNNIKKPLFYIPHCIDMDIYHKDIKPMYKYDKFTFLFMGTWKVRKGYQQLIEAWLNGFSDKDDVQLMIKTDKTKEAQEYIFQTKKKLGNKGFAPILFESKVFDEKALPQFMKSFNCLIEPTYGEGFGLPGLQSMALGVPVIITNFSGCQDYANEQTSTLLEPEGFVLHSGLDAIPQFCGKKWAFLSIKQIQEKMKYVINNEDIISQKADYANSYVKEKFNYLKIEQMFSEMIGLL